MTNHMQPDDQQSPATEAAPASAEAAETTVPAEARPVPVSYTHLTLPTIYSV